ncbi:ABC transporter permease [Streptomyces spinoverrucosus]|uniref:ABC transporter permease n=1 Tax=Streptomyces spinoverrucosus TaxID=284043 RepID=A0A4Y3VT06_9ACTN|nr:ABC transporter permease [Streptomyces spinoverrucosus]GEC09763.1 ABC transporter permease [Streptomyces spinoverrucosus]GHB52185.1 ABC transporter permease [Streptomyces spinoverrucosus]
MTTTITAPHRVTQSRVLHAEWHKLRTLRSTWISLALVPALTLATGLTIGASYESGDADEMDVVLLTLLGMQFTQIVVGVLGILATAGEHSTGLIRSTMTAVPRRLPVLWSKAAVIGTVSFVAVLATNLVTFSAVQTVLTGTDKAASLTDPGILQALVGNAAGLALLAVTALALGALIRHVAGAIGVLIGLLMILPEVLRMLPYDVIDDAVRYFPAKAVEALTVADPAPGMTSPGSALLALALWAAATLAMAAWVLRRRDV